MMKIWSTDVLPKWEQRLEQNKELILKETKMDEKKLKEVMEILYEHRVID